MYKIIFLITLSLAALFNTACSYFTFNAAICKQIATDPLATMPEECRIYSEEEAEKSFNNTQDKRMESDEIIEFTKEK